ncbi:hypothetical protein F441_08049 [Phytophthora nicotianae CJ01A1]|uniref:ZSWIM1/3 RNaseH-like domain-containing protein n=3 Tax=Phytophthora nicotianae TaxID=4792 RepID=W2Q926_PHYN3|nr:hypothetical protein PPTG_11292 [Phytophthora nicotianae INRA-310]ETL41116.1 hypothetical protein L916_07830 [Phytophthora nicotianae]ETL94273.1 hypothetical protein L917_07721 [Phytophthora nicotianae]ETN09683.1 hypothetical protein PPTG_11292 [Phytophthora nicotianae INRA-310]ETP17580.1 hypothetical protein F441_08049 [Phytophthora nicotianae CJ01A1]
MVFDQVGVLADTNTESNQIQQFISGALDRHVTPHQAHNIFRKVLKSTSADKQLSRMPDTVATFADHLVLVIRDQNDVTSGVVIQSAVQRLAFERWGESLCMDWTYGTNNVGFHLGSLLATSATGRGVPVLDFIALDERMRTMEAILEFFKKHNNHRDVRN